MSNLSENIKYCRVRKGMTQEQLAKHCGLADYKTVQKWEYGIAALKPKESVQILRSRFTAPRESGIQRYDLQRKQHDRI